MKKLFISIIAVPFLFYGCKKKKDDPAPVASSKSKTELLTQHSWKLATSTSDRAIDFDQDGTASTNIMAQRKSCQNDDVLTFTNSSSSSKTGSKDQGPTKCDDKDAQNITFNWRWNDSETVLKTTAFYIFTEDYTVLDLNDATLKVTYGDKDKDGVNYIVTDVYIKP